MNDVEEYKPSILFELIKPVTATVEVKLVVELNGAENCIAIQSDEDTVNLNQVEEYLAIASLTGHRGQTLFQFEIYDEDLNEWTLIDRKFRIPNLSKLRITTKINYAPNEDDERRDNYLVINGNGGETIVIDVETFDEVWRRNLPETKKSAIAVCDGMFYVISTGRGHIQRTHVSNLLTRTAIAWERCAGFPATRWARGNVAVVGHVVYFMNRSCLFAFDTKRNTVNQLDEVRDEDYFSLVEANGLIYCWRENGLHFTDGTRGWTAIGLPSSFGQLPYNASLIKLGDRIWVTGGETAAFDYLNSVLCYNTKSKSWSTVDPMDEGRYAAATVALDGRGAVVIGGYNGKEWIDSTLLLDEVSEKWFFISYKVLTHKLVFPQAVTFNT